MQKYVWRHSHKINELLIIINYLQLKLLIAVIFILTLCLL